MYITLLVFLAGLFSFSPVTGENSYDEEASQRAADVPKGEVIKGDYFSLGDTLIEGTIQGTAYLLGADIRIEGTVEKSLVVLAGSVFISGRVGGNVHVLAGQVILEGVVEGNVSLIGANLLLSEPGEIRGDLFVIAGNTSLEQTIDGSVTAITSSLTLSGTIKKNLHTFVDSFRITKSGEVLGSINYRSRNKVMVDSKTRLNEVMKHHETILGYIEQEKFFSHVSMGTEAVRFFVKFFYTFTIGLLLIGFFPNKLKRTVKALRNRPVKSFVSGLAVLLLLPVLAGILLVSVIGAPFALTLIALNIISFYTVTVFPVLWFSNAVFSKIGWRQNTIFALAFGLTTYYFLTLIPVVGFFTACFSVILGFGATVVAQNEGRQNSA